MTSRLTTARRVVDHAWPIYDGTATPTDVREDVVRQAIEAAFPGHGITLNEADIEELGAAAISARRSQIELIRLWREKETLYKHRPDDATCLASWGAGVAARQTGDWVKLVERLLFSLRRYRVVDGPDAGPPARRRAAQRFARRCAADLGIAAPDVQWIQPVHDGGDLVTLGDIAGCTPKHDPSVIFVRCDIPSDRERLRVVAHEVAHQSGADERSAAAYELVALRRHNVPLHSGSGSADDVITSSALPERL